VWGGGGGWAVAEVGGSGRKWGRQIFFFGDTIQRLQYVLAHVNDSNTTAHVQCYLCIESKKEFFGKLPLPPDCRPIAARLPPHQICFFFDTIQRLQWVLAHVYDSNTLTYVQCYLCIESRKEFGGK